MRHSPRPAVAAALGLLSLAAVCGAYAQPPAADGSATLGALTPENFAKPRPKAPFDVTGTWQHELRGPQSSCSGNEHEPIGVRANEDRLQNAVTANARRQLVEAGLRERSPWIGRRFVDYVRWQLSELTHSDTSGEWRRGR